MASKLAGLDADYKAWYNKGWRSPSRAAAAWTTVTPSTPRRPGTTAIWMPPPPGRSGTWPSAGRTSSPAALSMTPRGSLSTSCGRLSPLWPPWRSTPSSSLSSPQEPQQCICEDRRWLVNEANPKLGRGVITELFATSASDPAGAQAEANKVLGHDYTWVPKGHGFQAVLS